MKDGKAAGILGVPAEGFKYAATSATRALHSLRLSLLANARLLADSTFMLLFRRRGLAELIAGGLSHCKNP